MRTYVFRPLTARDLPLVERWRCEAHVMEWWGPPVHEPEVDKLDDPRIRMWIVEWEGQPLAFAQDYDPHSWGSSHHFSNLPKGARGIDQYIGEAHMLGQGHGSRFVRQHCTALFDNGAPAIGTDPHPLNRRAIRAYQKAGFELASSPVQTEWGLAVLMELWR